MIVGAFFCSKCLPRQKTYPRQTRVESGTQMSQFPTRNRLVTWGLQRQAKVTAPAPVALGTPVVTPVNSILLVGSGIRIVSNCPLKPLSQFAVSAIPISLLSHAPISQTTPVSATPTTPISITSPRRSAQHGSELNDSLCVYLSLYRQHQFLSTLQIFRVDWLGNWRNTSMNGCLRGRSNKIAVAMVCTLSKWSQSSITLINHYIAPDRK